jgi:hypothetical protein
MEILGLGSSRAERFVFYSYVIEASGFALRIVKLTTLLFAPEVLLDFLRFLNFDITMPPLNSRFSSLVCIQKQFILFFFDFKQKKLYGELGHQLRLNKIAAVVTFT